MSGGILAFLKFNFVSILLSHQGSSSVTQSNSNELWFTPLFRLVGYGLLILALFDIIDIFVPPRFTNPAWEFQTVGNLVERVPVPLLGLVLVFSSETSVRVFKFLSTACLVVAVLFLLLIPLGISSALRLDQASEQEISNLINQRSTQVQQLKDQLSKATTAQDIEQVLARLNPQGRPPQINNPQEVKSRLLANLDQADKSVKSQAEAKQANTRLVLIKNVLKSSLGAAVSSVVFFSLWRSNRRALKVNRGR